MSAQSIVDLAWSRPTVRDRAPTWSNECQRIVAALPSCVGARVRFDALSARTQISVRRLRVIAAHLERERLVHVDTNAIRFRGDHKETAAALDYVINAHAREHTMLAYLSESSFACGQVSGRDGFRRHVFAAWPVADNTRASSWSEATSAIARGRKTEEATSTPIDTITALGRNRCTHERRSESRRRDVVTAR